MGAPLDSAMTVNDSVPYRDPNRWCVIANKQLINDKVIFGWISVEDSDVFNEVNTI